MASKAVAQGGIHDKIVRHAHAEVSKLTPQEVLAVLKEEGITSLEDLVKKSLDGIRSQAPGGGVYRDTFIYTQAIYKISRSASEGLIRELGE